MRHLYVHILPFIVYSVDMKPVNPCVMFYPGPSDVDLNEQAEAFLRRYQPSCPARSELLVSVLISRIYFSEKICLVILSARSERRLQTFTCVGWLQSRSKATVNMDVA